MRSYCAVYVDVGYLLASAATRVTGSSLRSGIEVDYPGLIAGLVAQVEADSGLPLLRVNWYDSGARSGGQPDYHQDQIGLLPRIKLRLGRLSYAGEQKGVDVRLGLDLALQGRARVADVVYLVSGDDDLTEAVEEAQSAGVQVVLLSVPAQNGQGHAVSKHLRRAADGEQPIDPAIIDRCVRSRALAEGLAPDPADETSDGAADEQLDGRVVAAEGSFDRVGVPADDGADPDRAEAPVDAGASSPEPAPASERPADDEALTPEAGSAAAEPPGPDTADIHSPEGQSAVAGPPSTPTPTPAVFGRRRATEVVLPAAQPPPTWSTSTGDRPVAEGGVFDPQLIDVVAKTVLDSWCRTATPDALVALRASKPTIPGDLDRALLLDLSSRAGFYDIDDASRHEVRERFWFHVARVRLT
ncbi:MULTISPECIES: NYN domain-containing protein [unclassified Knoellia]|uniref:NYN domain-containing protein n=1 Tax=Knoellia altitudinis TaxID=3404795 RepID=UPI0036115B02